MPCECGKNASLKCNAPRHLVTTVGDIDVVRGYYRCRGCGQTQSPWDDWAGMCKGHLTPSCRRLACLAATGWSFDLASERLREMCGVSVSDQTVRRVAEEEGAAAGKWLGESATAARPVRDAKGEAEFYTDGTMVNTRRGWREMRLSIFAKRPAGAGLETITWDAVRTRELPATAARLATCHIAPSEEMGELWSAAAERLGLRAGRGLSVIGDGAKWIWKQADLAFPAAETVVDVYHVKEHMHECGHVLHGPETPEARDWAESQALRLIQSGSLPYLSQLQGIADGQACDPARRRAVEALDDYLRPNVNSLDYAGRLRRGLPIGSGMVEGACKTIVGRRLKCNSARWIPEHAQQVVSLCCLQYSGLWADYWDARAA